MVVAMAIQGSLRSASRLWLASAASTSVTGSSMMKMGCTSAIGPVASAAAWATAATMTMPMPASHTRRLTRSAMSDTCMDRSAGTWAAARRCSTDAHALLAAVSSAKNTQTTVCAAIGWMCTWIPASVSPAVQPVHGGLSGSSSVGVRAEGGERAQVGQALTALLPPGPLPPDGGREAEHQRLVERLVGVAQHAAEQPVDLRLGDGGQRQPAGQVHVAGAVEREVDAVHAGAALKQEAVERRVILVRLAAEERLHLKAVVPGDQPGHSGELMLSVEADEVSARGLALVAQAQAVEDAAEDVGGSGVVLLHRRLTP